MEEESDLGKSEGGREREIEWEKLSKEREGEL